LTSELIKIIEKIALKAVGNTKPPDFLTGKVVTIDPLTINVNNAVLPANFFVQSTLVSDFRVDMTVDHLTEDRAGGGGEASFASHNHEYKGRKTFFVHLGLLVGESVILARCSGGQKFIILDRVRYGNEQL